MSVPPAFYGVKFKMEMDEVRSVNLHLGNSKHIRLVQTLLVKQTIGKQGALISGPKREQFVLIPRGALHSDTEIEIIFYRVNESVGLDKSEFVTSMVEITPHELKFEKPIEILMSHYLFIQSGSSKVTVLYNSGKPADNDIAPICQLMSVNETRLASGMTMSLWEDFVHIETSHICRFDLQCEGKYFIEVWAYFLAPKVLHPETFIVELFLVPKRVDVEELKMLYMPGCDLECRHCKLITLNCKEKEDLQVTVEIPSSADGWKQKGDSDLSQNISYTKIQSLVVQNWSHISTSFGFIKDRTSNSHVLDFAPDFTLNGVRCILSPSNRQSTPHTRSAVEPNKIPSSVIYIYLNICFCSLLTSCGL